MDVLRWGRTVPSIQGRIHEHKYKYNGFKIIKLLERTRRWLHSESTLVSRYQILVIDYDN